MGQEGVATSVLEGGQANDGVPLLNEQVAMEARGVISEPLFTGVPVRNLAGEASLGLLPSCFEFRPVTTGPQAFSYEVLVS